MWSLKLWIVNICLWHHCYPWYWTVESCYLWLRLNTLLIQELFIYWKLMIKMWFSQPLHTWNPIDIYIKDLIKLTLRPLQKVFINCRNSLLGIWRSVIHIIISSLNCDILASTIPKNYIFLIYFGYNIALART